MSILKNIIKIAKGDYDVLVEQGSITKGGVVYTYDPDETLYMVDDGLSDDYVVLGGGSGVLLDKFGMRTEINDLTSRITNETSARKNKDTELSNSISTLSTTVAIKKYPAVTDGYYYGLMDSDEEPNKVTEGTDAKGAVALGCNNTIGDRYTFVAGSSNTVSGNSAVAVGQKNTASGIMSFASGLSNTASGMYSAAIGYGNIVSGKASVTVGYKNTVTSNSTFAEGNGNIGCGTSAHVEGSHNIAYGGSSHAGGESTAAIGYASVTYGGAWGMNIYLTGDANATTYTYTVSSEDANIANYYLIIGNGLYINTSPYTAAYITAVDTANKVITLSRTLNSSAALSSQACWLYCTVAKGDYSFAMRGLSQGASSWTVNRGGHAIGNYSFVGGNCNIANNSSEVAFGSYNLSNTGTKASAFTLGRGTGDTDRKNIFEITTDGSVYALGLGSYTGTNPTGSKSIQEVVGEINTTLAGKANTSHTHSKSQITDFPSSMPASDVYAWAKASTKPSYTAGEVGAVASSLVGAKNGVASLDANGKVPTSQLPSYVDDVLEYSSKSGFPTTGETGKIYVATDTNLTYRWSGSAYVEISPSLALGETSSTAYAGDKGKVAYVHSQITSGNPHGVTKAMLGLGNVDNTADSAKSVKYAASAGSCTGNAATATKASTIVTKVETTNINRPVFFAYNADTSRVVYDTDFQYNPSSNTIILGTGTLSPTSYSGKAATAGTAEALKSSVNINGTSFNGASSITTSNWGTARNIYIADSSATNKGAAVSVNGSGEATLKLPATIKATITGNATTATTLQTGRTIAAGTAVTSEATSFNGSTNIIIPINSVKEAYLDWGGRNLTGYISPIDAAMSSAHSANRAQFCNPAGVTVEYSTDGGTTWTDYGLGDVYKIGLLSDLGSSICIGKKSSATASNPATVNDKVRVTLNATSMGVYTKLRKVLINVSTDGATGSNVTVERSMKGSETTWETIYSNFPVSGWSGWNSIDVQGYAFGGGTSQTGNIANLRFTFSITGVSSSYGSNLAIYNLLLFGETNWNFPSQMARSGHLYSYDASQNATFPAALTSTGAFTLAGTKISTACIKFSRNGANYILTGGGSGSALYICTANKSAGSASADLAVKNTVVSPGINAYSSLGSSSIRWKNVYAQVGDYSSSVTALSFVKSSGTASQFLMADGSVTTTKNLTASTNIGWSSTTADALLVPTMNTLAFWNGAYNANGASNLAYCDKGRFGTFATKSSLAFSELTDISGVITTNGGELCGDLCILSNSCNLVFTSNGSYESEIQVCNSSTEGTSGILSITDGMTSSYVEVDFRSDAPFIDFDGLANVGPYYADADGDEIYGYQISFPTYKVSSTTKRNFKSYIECNQITTSVPKIYLEYEWTEDNGKSWNTEKRTVFTDEGGTINGDVHIEYYEGTNHRLTVAGTIYSKTGIYTAGYVSAKGQDTSSDISLKKDLAPITNALDYVLDTKYWRFKWKDSDEYCVGIVAQEELGREYGFLVRKHQEQDTYSYDYAASTALLGTAIQEEDKKVEELKARIEQLENEIKTLKYGN